MRLKHALIAIAVVAIALTAIFFVMRPEEPSVSAPPPLAIAAVHKAGPSWAYPDPRRTPGFTNPDVTQENIEQTICNPEWSTKSIRPPESYTTGLKKKQMQAWGLPGTTADYEEDHLISLELGGSPSDSRNLWPEPYNPSPDARQKDTVENYLYKEVCI